ncbi:MAG: hypothetical protein GC186_00295 [Rhodobacteraceae bacterium]|nr:hypothetical protein [Paracoccaceae bacterium]
MNTKHWAAAALMAVTLAGSAGAATVTMTGDNVTIKYLNPDAATELTGYGFPVNVTVAPGTSDVVQDAFPGGPYFTVNMEPTSIVVTFLQNTVFGPPSPFDGIGITGITQHIYGLTQTATFSGIVSQVGQTILFNFAGSNVYAAGSTVTANLTLTPAPVPLPAGIMALLAALAGLGLVARRRAA